MRPGGLPLIAHKDWVPHPFAYSAKGWETTNPNPPSPFSQPAFSRAFKSLPSFPEMSKVLCRRKHGDAVTARLRKMLEIPRH
jgi:hypothetical protein